MLRGKPFKMIKNAFYFTLKALSRDIYIFVKKAKVNLKIYDVTDWTTNNYNTYIVQYLKK